MTNKIHTPGEKFIPGFTLKEIKEYDSAHDPDFPATPLALLLVGQELCRIVLITGSSDTEPAHPTINGTLPDFISLNHQETEDQRFISFHIPIHQISSILVKAGDIPFGGYELPGRYEYIIELNTNEILRVEGTFEESFEEKDGMPEYWFYSYNIRVE